MGTKNTKDKSAQGLQILANLPETGRLEERKGIVSKVARPKFNGAAIDEILHRAKQAGTKALLLFRLGRKPEKLGLNVTDDGRLKAAAMDKNIEAIRIQRAQASRDEHFDRQQMAPILARQAMGEKEAGADSRKKYAELKEVKRRQENAKYTQISSELKLSSAQADAMEKNVSALRNMQQKASQKHFTAKALTSVLLMVLGIAAIAGGFYFAGAAATLKFIGAITAGAVAFGFGSYKLYKTVKSQQQAKSKVKHDAEEDTNEADKKIALDAAAKKSEAPVRSLGSSSAPLSVVDYVEENTVSNAL